MKTSQIVLIAGLIGLALILWLGIAYSYPYMMGWPFNMWGMGMAQNMGVGMMHQNMGHGMMNGMHNGMMQHGPMAGSMQCGMMGGYNHEYMEQHMANMEQMHEECMQMMHQHMGDHQDLDEMN